MRFKHFPMMILSVCAVYAHAADPQAVKNMQGAMQNAVSTLPGPHPTGQQPSQAQQQAANASGAATAIPEPRLEKPAAMPARVFSAKDREMASQLEALAIETAVLNAKSKQADLMKKVADTKKAMPDQQSPNPFEQISVIAIESFDGKRIVTVTYDGQVFEKTVGQSIGRDLVIDSISSDSIVLAHGKKKKTIGLSGGSVAMTPAASTSMSGMGGMGMLPPPMSQNGMYNPGASLNNVRRK